MRTKYVVEGKPDKQVLEQFFDGTLPTPCELDERAAKLAAEQEQHNKKEQRLSRRRRTGL